VEEDGVVPRVGEGAPGLVGDVEGGEGRGVGEGEGAGVVVDTVGERARTGVGGFGAGVGLGEAGVGGGDDAGLPFGVCIDAGEGRRRHGGGTGRRQPERAAEHPGGERRDATPLRPPLGRLDAACAVVECP